MDWALGSETQATSASGSSSVHLIGVVGGIGAIAFSQALSSWRPTSSSVCLGGYTPPSPAGRRRRARSRRICPRPWAHPPGRRPGRPDLGDASSTDFAPEAEGHGTDAAIAAYHHNPRGIRGRVPLVKLVASAVTIGSGGSAGREGPTAQISAGFGSLPRRVTLDLDARGARIAVAVGIGSGDRGDLPCTARRCGAGGRDPVPRATRGRTRLIPSVHRHDHRLRDLRRVEGFAPIFGFLASATHFERSGPARRYYALIGLALAGSWASVRPRVLRHRQVRRRGLAAAAMGEARRSPGLLVGMHRARRSRRVLGTGYGWVQQAMTTGRPAGHLLWIVLALPFAKILATSLTIGSGGSGGIFGPGMMIGGVARGIGSGDCLRRSPGRCRSIPAPFVVVGDDGFVRQRSPMPRSR